VEGSSDRNALKEKMITCVYILDREQHAADGLVNIVTGKVITDPKVNVDLAITNATSDRKKFEAGWPA
jgi:hypothetical protein